MLSLSDGRDAFAAHGFHGMRKKTAFARILSPWLNPVMWLIGLLAVWKHITAGLWALAAVALLLARLP